MDLLSFLIHSPDILYTIPYKADFVIAQISHVVPGPWASCLTYLKFQFSHNIHIFFSEERLKKILYKQDCVKSPSRGSLPCLM